MIAFATMERGECFSRLYHFYQCISHYRLMLNKASYFMHGYP